jgi:hypothetical protein
MDIRLAAKMIISYSLYDGIAGRQSYCGVEVSVLDREDLMADWQSRLRRSSGIKSGLETSRYR